MVGERIIHGLNCPECGGPLELEEGRSLVQCPHCGISSLLRGERAVWRLQARRTIGNEQALEVVLRFISGSDKAPDLRRLASVKEYVPIYVPYWSAWARVAAWIFGQRSGDDTTYPVEKAILEDYVWTGVATDISELGLQKIAPEYADLDLFDPETLQDRAVVFDPTRPQREAEKQARLEFEKRARQQAGVSTITFERFQLLREKLVLIYYPLWLVRYTYRGRAYQVIVDGVTGRVLHGRAPGRPELRALGFVASWLVGIALPVNMLMMLTVGLSRAEDLPSSALQRIGLTVPVIFSLGVYSAVFWLVVALSLFIMSAGYRLFRFGGERIVGEESLQQVLGSYFKRLGFTGHWVERIGCVTWLVVWIGWLMMTVSAAWLPEAGRLPIMVIGQVVFLSVGLFLGWMNGDSASHPAEEILATTLSKETKPGSSAKVVYGRPSLHPLHCPDCHAPVPARDPEVAYVCQNCGCGMELGTERMNRIDVAFARPQAHVKGLGPVSLPFWIFDGEVDVRYRQAEEKTVWQLQKRESDDRAEMWRDPRRFYVPAFDASVPDLQQWGVSLTKLQPDFPPGSEPGELKGCVLTQEEARKLAEFVFLSIEYSKSDILQRIDYHIGLTSPRLVVVPFQEEKEGAYPFFPVQRVSSRASATWPQSLVERPSRSHSRSGNWDIIRKVGIALGVIVLIYIVCSCLQAGAAFLILGQMYLDSLF